ncbi:MAG: TonB-dependent receptor [Gemmatimonadaceae bacterium]|nr:TonB-dependent receptor [Gemmatimonadaceae bacterium]
MTSHVFARAALLAALLTVLPSGIALASHDQLSRAEHSGATHASSRVDVPAIMGTVRDTAGRPLSNAQIVVSVVNRVLQSDANGSFVVRGLAAGTYHLDVSLIGFAPQHAVVSLPETGADVAVDIVLRRSALRLTGVIVSAAPTGTDPLGVTQATVELSGKNLALNMGGSVAQTLAGEPGMAMRYNGPMANAPVIRGLTGERILVLQDGERTGDLSSASADHALSIDPFSADRIEVIRGPASLLYGNNALGGVVNVISNDIPTTVPGQANFFIGGQGETVTPGGVLGGGGSIPLGSRFALTARGTVRKSDDLRVGGGGTQANTDASSSGGSVGLGFIGERGQVGVAVRTNGFEFGVPYPTDGEAIRLDGRRSQVALRATLNTGLAFLPTFRVDGTAQQYSHDEIEPDGTIGTNFKLNTETFNVVGRTEAGRLTGTVGLQGYLRAYEPTGDEAFTPSADNRNVGILLFQELPLTREVRRDSRVPKLQLGARYDWFTLVSKDGGARFGPARSRDFNSTSASLGLNLPLGDVSTLSLNGQRAFRAPAVEEVFADGYHVAAGSYDVGNPGLRAETSTGIEGVLRSQGGKGFVQVSAYLNAIRDYIVPRAVGTIDVAGEDGPIEVPLVNFVQRDARLFGFEAQGEAEVARHWVLGGSADWVRGRFDNDENLPFIPAGRLGTTLRWDSGRLSLGGGMRAVFRQGRVSGDALDVATDSYTLVNLSIGWTVLRGAAVQNIVLRADNLLDERYFDATSRIKSFAPNPGRNLAVVYKVIF